MQENAADLFFQAPACFLDRFSLKLRAIVQSKEALLHEDTLKFLAEVFDRVVPTSTCIERDFARLNRWCDRKGPKPKLSTLAAKHVVYHFRRLTETWRLKAIKEGQICKPKSNRSRPAWAHGAKRGHSQNGIHIFAKETGLNPANGLMWQWRLLPLDTRRQYATLARVQNLQSKAAQASDRSRLLESEKVCGGFWEMSASSGFPLRRDIVVDNFEDFHKLGQEFKDSSCDLLPEADDSFAGAPEMPGPLWAECHPDACPHALPGRQRKAYSTLIDLVLETIMRQAPRPSCPMEEPLLLQFTAPTARVKRYAAVAYNSRKNKSMQFWWAYPFYQENKCLKVLCLLWLVRKAKADLWRAWGISASVLNWWNWPTTGKWPLSRLALCGSYIFLMLWLFSQLTLTLCVVGCSKRRRKASPRCFQALNQEARSTCKEAQRRTAWQGFWQRQREGKRRCSRAQRSSRWEWLIRVCIRCKKWFRTRGPCGLRPCSAACSGGRKPGAASSCETERAARPGVGHQASVPDCAHSCRRQRRAHRIGGHLWNPHWP